MNKTIAAIATPMGQGGVGVVRVSGDKAYQIGCALTKRSTLKPRYAHFVGVYDASDQKIDEGVLLYFQGPRSFTGEDVVEIQGHGGVALPELVLRRCFELGAAPAEPGEFSYRAFCNQKIDLAQAEAIADAISAVSTAQALSATRALFGEFSKKINNLNEDITRLRLRVEAAIDFSDEEGVEFLQDANIQSALEDLIDRLKATLASAQSGSVLQSGVHAVLMGRPNAGKSSLLNALAGFERAIVSDTAGTTRDTVQETVLLHGLSARLTDTAGLRQTRDAVEQIGIDRAKAAIKNADLLILVRDLSQKGDPNDDVDALLGEFLDEQSQEQARGKLVVVGNKVDLTAHKAGLRPDGGVYVSCETQAGLEELVDALCERVGFYPNENTVIARARHVDALRRALAFLLEAKDQLLLRHAGELCAESLRLAHRSLGEITGQTSADDLLGRIFSQFCIGK